MQIKDNPLESQQNYEKKKYVDWIYSGGMVDPSVPPCSVCRKRTNDVVLKSNRGRDYLVCVRHLEGDK